MSFFISRVPFGVASCSDLCAFPQQRTQLPEFGEWRGSLLLVVPAIVAPQPAEMAGHPYDGGIQALSGALVGRHIQRVGIAVQLTHKAGLTLIQARDQRPAIRSGIQHMCRARGDAGATAGA